MNGLDVNLNRAMSAEKFESRLAELIATAMPNALKGDNEVKVARPGRFPGDGEIA